MTDIKSYIITTALKSIFIILLFISNSTYNFASGNIFFNNDYPELDTIFIDVVRVNDSSATLFTLKNPKSLSTVPLKISKNLPSFYFGESPMHPEEWEEFAKYTLSGEIFEGDIEIKSDSSYTFKVVYTADSRLLKYPLGTKEMRLILGLYDPQKPLPISDKDLIAVDTFLLKAKKTYHWLDSYYNYHDFDSVYINYQNNPVFIWRLKNISKSKSFLTDYTFKDSSDRREFFISKPELPLEIEAGTPRSVIDSWKIKYRPLNRGRDSAFLSINYNPLPIEIADTIPMPFISIRGFAVEQEINLIDAGEFPIVRNTVPDTLGITDSIVSYSIIVGDVRIGTAKEIKGIIKNDGNINFGIINQSVLKQFADLPAEDITITQFLQRKGVNLKPGSLDTFKIIFTPNKIGEYVFRFSIESDIANRKIQGISPYAKKMIINIIARGISPKFSVKSDTLDLGSVVIGCPPERKEIVYINNEGNQELIVTPFIKYPSPFTVEPEQISVPPLSNESLTFTYRIYEKRSFIQEVKLTTNENSPDNVHYIYLTGDGIPLRSAKVSIPNLNAQPGRIIAVPIIVSENAASYAGRYQDTIYFDPSLLSFIAADFQGTASEGSNLSEETKVEIVANGKIYIKLAMPLPSQYFRERDTLVKLLFGTYLGNKISAPISMHYPLFSDAICPEVLSIDPNTDIIHGSFTVDSVCGLAIKAFERSSAAFTLDKVSPIPASDIAQIHFSIPFETNVEISIYNAFGSKAAEIINLILPPGKYYREFPIHGLSPGTYYISMKVGIFSGIEKLLIAR